MTFNSIHFAWFFLAVFTCTALLRRHVSARNLLLLAASYLFYGWWDWRFLSLLWISTLFDYACGLFLDRPPDGAVVRRRRDKAFLVASMALNLGFLGFFKYFNFFTGSAAAALTSLGFRPNVSTLNVVLPVGISFYTFQSMSYVIDVYRGGLRAERNLLTFALFIAFFPQLVAGPIERATSLLPQLRKPNVMTWPAIYSGCYLIGWGLIKKVVIADNVAPVVERVFSANNPSGGTALIGIYAFAIQIYCDFSGYTDVARGTARTMGFELMRNFDLPYFATNPSDFWRRWHISLSTWLRDYLYLPLGGNRKGPARTYVNLMLTMVLGGLWHGAAWTFVLWGAFHGALLCLHRFARPWLERWADPRGPIASRAWFFLRALVFFQLVCFGWLLFRANSLAQVGQMLGAIGRSLTVDANVLGPSVLAVFIACAAVLLLVQLVQFVSKNHDVIWRLPVPVRAALYAVGILAFVLFGEFGGEAFIYFQF